MISCGSLCALFQLNRLLKSSWPFTVIHILPEATVPLKMHLLEDHAVQWANTYHVGFGLLGEQGAESIHAKFNRLGLVFAPIRGTCCA